MSGTVHAASGGRRVCVYGVNGSTLSGLICSPYAYAGGPNTTLIGSLNIPQPGGVVRVYLTMYDENNSELAQEYCTRIGCTRVY